MLEQLAAEGDQEGKLVAGRLEVVNGLSIVAAQMSLAASPVFTYCVCHVLVNLRPTSPALAHRSTNRSVTYVGLPL